MWPEKIPALTPIAVPARPRLAGRGVLLAGVLFVLMSLCHGTVMANTSGSATLPEQLLVANPQDGAPPHVVDCAVDSEIVTPGSIRGDDAWVSPPQVGDDLFVWRQHSLEAALAPTHTIDASVRRALLQVFLI